MNRRVCPLQQFEMAVLMQQFGWQRGTSVPCLWDWKFFYAHKVYFIILDRLVNVNNLSHKNQNAKRVR